jgi:RNA polymerase sigma-70 factor (ECF subfamily)
MELNLELVRAAQNGDRNAERRLFRTYRELVLRIAFRQLGPFEDIDEAVQEIFIRLFSSLGRFKGNCRFETWVYRVGLNVCADILRRKLRKRKLVIDASATEKINEYADRSADALSELISSENISMIYGALDSLDKTKRAVLILHDVEEKSLDEIGDIMGIPVGTVKSRLFYARKMVKEALIQIKETESCCENRR